MKIATEIDLIPEDGAFLTISTQNGIEIGRYVQPTAIVSFLCSNETTPEEVGIKLSTKLQANVNLTVDNYFAYVFVSNATANGTTFLVDKVGIKKVKKDIIDIMINTGLQVGVEILNQEFTTPYDLKQLNPDYMVFIAQVFTQPRVTPFYQDEYLYAGISYFMDPFTQTKFDKLRIEQQIINQHASVIAKVVKQLIL